MFREELIRAEIAEKRETANKLRNECDALLQEWEEGTTPDHFKAEIIQKLQQHQEQYKQKIENKSIKKTLPTVRQKHKTPRAYKRIYKPHRHHPDS